MEKKNLADFSSRPIRDGEGNGVVRLRSTVLPTTATGTITSVTPYVVVRDLSPALRGSFRGLNPAPTAVIHPAVGGNVTKGLLVREAMKRKGDGQSYAQTAAGRAELAEMGFDSISELPYDYSEAMDETIYGHAARGGHAAGSPSSWLRRRRGGATKASAIPAEWHQVDMGVTSPDGIYYSVEDIEDFIADETFELGITGYRIVRQEARTILGTMTVSERQQWVKLVRQEYMNPRDPTWPPSTYTPYVKRAHHWDVNGDMITPPKQKKPRKPRCPNKPKVPKQPATTIKKSRSPKKIGCTDAVMKQLTLLREKGTKRLILSPAKAQQTPPPSAHTVESGTVVRSAPEASVGAPPVVIEIDDLPDDRGMSPDTPLLIDDDSDVEPDDELPSYQSFVEEDAIQSQPLDLHTPQPLMESTPTPPKVRPTPTIKAPSLALQAIGQYESDEEAETNWLREKYGAGHGSGSGSSSETDTAESEVDMIPDTPPPVSQSAVRQEFFPASQQAVVSEVPSSSQEEISSLAERGQIVGCSPARFSQLIENIHTNYERESNRFASENNSEVIGHQLGLQLHDMPTVQDLTKELVSLIGISSWHVQMRACVAIWGMGQKLSTIKKCIRNSTYGPKEIPFELELDVHLVYRLLNLKCNSSVSKDDLTRRFVRLTRCPHLDCISAHFLSLMALWFVHQSPAYLMWLMRVCNLANFEYDAELETLPLGTPGTENMWKISMQREHLIDFEDDYTIEAALTECDMPDCSNVAYWAAMRKALSLKM